ncbi:MAG TPA: response regulator [Humisphaera sp.]
MKKPLVLVVDDEPNIRLMLRTALESAGFVVDEAADGRQAIESIDRDVPDLMVLDLSMPVLDGMGVLRQLRDRPADRRPPVVVLTAYGSVPTAVRAVRLGARDFLEKPTTPDDLRAAVRGVLADDRPGRADDGQGRPTYDQVLDRVRTALREGQMTDAESLLMRAGSIAADDDAAFLNLAGVFHEAMGRRPAAKRYYGKAIRANGRYEPAQQNMRRLFELDRFGRTKQLVALGDEPEFAADGSGGPPGSILERLRRLIVP